MFVCATVERESQCTNNVSVTDWKKGAIWYEKDVFSHIGAAPNNYHDLILGAPG